MPSSARKHQLIRAISALLVCFMLIPTLASCNFDFDFAELLGLSKGDVTTEESTPAETEPEAEITTENKDENTTEAPTTEETPSQPTPPPEPNKYTVTFVNYDGSVIETQNDVVEDETVTAPDDPTRNGFVFLGWFLNETDETAFDFTTPIKENITLTARWEELNVYLTCTATELYTGEGTMVYFYAQTKGEITSVDLYNKNTNELIGTMRDDGLYSESGDDLPNDGIFSFKTTLSETEAVTLIFSALSNTQIESNLLEIAVIVPLTQEEINSIQNVNDTITQTIGETITAEMSNDEKAEAIQEVLISLSAPSAEGEETYIQEESICYDSENGVVSFTYENGVAGLIILDDFTNIQTGIQSTASAVCSPMSNVIAGAIMLPQVGSGTNVVKTVGDATIMYSFDDYSNSDLYDCYNNFMNQWTQKGLLTKIYANPTVEEYKTAFLGSELIVIAEHGSVFTHGIFNTEKTYLIVTAETVTQEKNKLYSSDIKSGRICIATLPDNSQVYCLTAKFFQFYYNGNKLDNSIVYMGNCMSLGSGKALNKDFENAFVKCAGANALYGYHESVYHAYSLQMLNSIVNDLLAGQTAGAAMKNAVAEFGQTDHEYMLTLYPNWDFGKKAAATPHLLGDEDATLISFDFMNGSFEDALNYWNTVGDVRILKKLAELNPTDAEHMAILTTGIGSSENEYIQGTEGSLLLQTFVVPQNATAISLSYNVVSEEPMEWVGRGYDDCFVVELLNQDNEIIHQLAFESIDTSTWYQIDGIDFEGGDHTTYQTDWINVTFEELAQYEGQTLTLRFRVWDVGDSIYDTAALIDNVRLY